MSKIESAFPAFKEFAWKLHDEGQYAFLALKYADREKLHEEYQARRKQADKSETVDGKPNPQYLRMRMEAEMAQLRFEMSYIICKNHQLEEQVNILAGLFERVGLLEGAYGYCKMLAETAKMIYDSLSSKKKEQPPEDPKRA